MTHVEARAYLIEPLFGFDPPRFSGALLPASGNFLHCDVAIRMQHMSAVSGSLFFEATSRQAF